MKNMTARKEDFIMQKLPESEFWDFSLDVYGRPEVSKLCLDLQDSYGVDVNMLLFACWLGHTGRGTVTVSAWRAMGLRLNKWRDEVIKPLRSVRHMLKHEHLAPLDMKEQVFKCEIDAEHIEQLILEKEWGNSRRSKISDSTRRTQDMIENLVTYLKAEKVTLDSKLAYRCERLVKHIGGLLDDKLIRSSCQHAMGLSSGDSQADITMP